MEPEQIQLDLTHPSVTDHPETVIKSVEIHDDPYAAANTAHAIVICTEWDEFVVSTAFPRPHVRFGFTRETHANQCDVALDNTRWSYLSSVIARDSHRIRMFSYTARAERRRFNLIVIVRNPFRTGN